MVPMRLSDAVQALQQAQQDSEQQRLLLASFREAEQQQQQGSRGTTQDVISFGECCGLIAVCCPAPPCTQACLMCLFCARQCS